MPGSLPFAEPTERRIRVRLAGRTVADSRRAQLLVDYGPGRLPTYYLPAEDVRPDALTDEAVAADGRRSWAVTSGRNRVESAAWTHAGTTGDLAVLEGHVTFSWQRLEWYEGDERVVVEHARDPYKRVDTLRSSRQVEVAIAGSRWRAASGRCCCSRPTCPLGSTCRSTTCARTSSCRATW